MAKKLGQSNNNQQQNDSMAKQAADYTKKKVEKEAKKKAKAVAKKAAKRAAKAANRVIGKNGMRAARAVGHAAKAGIKVAASAVQSIFAFLITPPIGWAVSAVLILGIMWLIGNAKSVDYYNDNLYGDLTDEEIAYLMNQSCPYSPTVVEPDADSSQAGDGDWTKPGTTAYKNAKAIFDFWVDQGFSGAAAAGVVGWVQSEGGFSMLGRAEGCYSSNNPRVCSIAYGKLPTTYDSSYSVGGGGVYQFTPYTKYAPLNSKDWENAEKQSLFVRNAIVGGDWREASDLTNDYNTPETMAQQSDPQYAVLIWNAYERANVNTVKYDQKKRDAQLAYNMFNGEQYPYNANKFGASFGEDAQSGVIVADPTTDPCFVASGSDWKGTGGQPATTGGYYKPIEVPPDWRQYALDPESLGMMYDSVTGWDVKAWDFSQCTDLVASLMNKLWEKDGEHPVQAAGHGKFVAGNWADTFGGTTTNVPTAGAVFSIPGFDDYGHTGVVSHVFDNGDFLIIEQNVLGVSGAAINMTNTWNYRYVYKSRIGIEGYSFYNPASSGWKLVDGIKSL